MLQACRRKDRKAPFVPCFLVLKVDFGHFVKNKAIQNCAIFRLESVSTFSLSHLFTCASYKVRKFLHESAAGFTDVTVLHCKAVQYHAVDLTTCHQFSTGNVGAVRLGGLLAVIERWRSGGRIRVLYRLLITHGRPPAWTFFRLSLLSLRCPSSHTPYPESSTT